VEKSDKIKKFTGLGVLFLLPITVYLFFASGVNNFGKLPILTENVSDIKNFTSLEGPSVQLENHITVLGFFGKDVESKKANAFNLAHKIYKKYYQFQDFQFIIVIDENQKEEALQLKEKLKEIEDPKNWKFVFASEDEVQEVFHSLKSNYSLDKNMSSPYVFIIDHDNNLRGRDEDKDEDEGVLFGFDARDYSEINNKMDDDIKVIIAEYRLALKKYNSNREI
jgi:hypothetical protein